MALNITLTKPNKQNKMKTNKNVGFKEQVKSGSISAKQAFETLIKQANKAGGEIGVAVFRQSKAAKWLSRRIAFGR